MKIHKHHVEDANNYYDKFKQKYKFVDDGWYSAVYENKDPHSVIKVVCDKGYLIYLKRAILNHDNIHFPKIYEIVDIMEKDKYNFSLVVMEKLLKNPNENIRNRNTDKIINVAFRKLKKSSTLLLDKNYPYSFNNFIKIMKMLKDEDKMLRNDFNLRSQHNVMFRKNNDLVVIDPFTYKGGQYKYNRFGYGEKF